jgi:outer membrane lipoprotein-sorting protein
MVKYQRAGEMYSVKLKAKEAKYIAVAIIALIIATVTGCGESINLTEVTDKAVGATLNVQSYRISAEGVYITDGEISEINYEVDFVAPDRYRQKSGCPGCSGNGWNELVSIGDSRYLRTSEDEEWHPIPDADTASVSSQIQASDGDYLAYILEPLSCLRDIQELPDEVIDGFTYWHFIGKVDMEAFIEKKDETENNSTLPPEISALSAGKYRGSKYIELWISKEDYFIRQMNIKEYYVLVNVTTGEVRTLTGETEIQLNSFNEPIIIEPPGLG